MKRYTQEEIDALIVTKNNQKIIRDVDFSGRDLSHLDLREITFINCRFAQC